MSSIVREMCKVAKRKKRKTRRCLDEMRNRSLRTMRGGDLSAHRVNPIGDQRKASNLVTTNRITLNMFPKSIRSETITRPVLEDIKQQSSYGCKDLVRNPNRRFPNNMSNVEVQCSEHSYSAASNKSIPLFDLEEGSEHQNMYLNSPDPTQVGKTQTPTAASLYSTTSVSSQTSEGDHAHELYEELINKVSSHIKNISSGFIKEDFMKITKTKLKKLLHNSIDNKSPMVFESPEELPVHNPLCYIKHYKKEQKLEKYNESDLSEPSSPAPSLPEPESSPHSALDISGVFTNSAFYNTPQYNYYPHKLN